jgi:flavin reductase (DIM6/NTAB) family NADH-FMN oxidoreductase RutF
MAPDAATSDVRTEALHLLSNGIYVLTAAAADTFHAATVTWAVQVSFQPALVLVALRRNSHLAQAVRKAHRFALNILAEDQQAVAERFFTNYAVPAEPGNGPPIGGSPTGGPSSGPPDWPFRLTVGKCPLLTDGMAWLECKLVAEPRLPATTR